MLMGDIQMSTQASVWCEQSIHAMCFYLLCEYRWQLLRYRSKLPLRLSARPSACACARPSARPAGRTYKI